MYSIYVKDTFTVHWKITSLWRYRIQQTLCIKSAEWLGKVDSLWDCPQTSALSLITINKSSHHKDLGHLWARRLISEYLRRLLKYFIWHQCLLIVLSVKNLYGPQNIYAFRKWKCNIKLFHDKRSKMQWKYMQLMNINQIFDQSQRSNYLFR